ncbi:hypothetical protein TNIN_269671 [Trichonephila inaurata madagascariensis]|uniref:Uncharacterized protein n=1 Tax=Trichonephila inaurata madagascariensis TaxID=2747483 RepID=A0A8X7CMS0_9ARAC|nr:hypothetical protein TNIN_269671 [Trichonephila inaurata madagascariensis]
MLERISKNIILRTNREKSRYKKGALRSGWPSGYGIGLLQPLQKVATPWLQFIRYWKNNRPNHISNCRSHWLDGKPLILRYCLKGLYPDTASGRICKVGVIRLTVVSVGSMPAPGQPFLFFPHDIKFEIALLEIIKYLNN